ncbi:tetratricopeptide (TPR) repeat protein [Allocatelliglobosispora scoriae]|uniref:Tetratricopeptide (TPR) repeat protein n=1 Tax=Allocatelliglobosispora scoriae TaxID=643052 RepID=A0A841BQJ3_9ACTN|nr:hypothetical protein [Allocatelliglobosispora scoriae]MBB5869596.1 tetratricopeptide (TPR) repeat protein [Allocatelliglobosispora scoriae]
MRTSIGGAVRRTPLLLTVVAALLALGAFAVRPATAPDDTGQTVVLTSADDQLEASITRMQGRLRDLPGDWQTWAALGMAYLERARITVDPGFYARAEGAFAESARLRPGNPEALTGLGALANARHDFGAARTLARTALAANAWSAEAAGVLADAETQLGNAAAATDAVQRMLDLRPGLPAYARAAYDLEQHGRVDEAGDLWRRALADATGPAEQAYVRQQLGDLAWNTGDTVTAAREYGLGLAAQPTLIGLRHGRARVSGSLTEWASLVQAAPTPTLLIEYAHRLHDAGRPSEAAAQLDLAEAALKLFAAGGGADDLTAAELAIARRQPADAVRLARREWQRRQHADVADVLGWALHLAGDDRTALTFARRATALGNRSATYATHLTAIERSLS